MPDRTLILQALAAAAGVAAAVCLLCAWPWRKTRPALAGAGGALGAGLGFLAGCWILGAQLHWPPREDQDRLLLLVLPAVVAVEVVAAFPWRRRWPVWLVRGLVAAGAARVLLHGSVYIAHSGSGSSEWTPGQTWLILGGLAAALAGVWALLTYHVVRRPGRVVPLSVALACTAAALTVMLSSYASGGMLGLALGAALAGALLASLALPSPVDVRGVLGVGVVGLFALLIVGRFFGELTSLNAGLIFAAPLLCFLVELPYARKLGPRLRALVMVTLVAAPLFLVLKSAHRTFEEEWSAPSSSTGIPEPTMQDYLDYGK
jgi:hypothetical protein